MIVYLNGRFLPAAEATLSVADRGFLFGDGIYEVIRVIEGTLFMAYEHLERLDDSLRHIEINLPDKPSAYFIGVMKELIRQNGLETGEASIYIQITRGAVFPRTHHFPEPAPEPTIYLSAGPFTPDEKLLQTGTSAITHPDERWANCHIKSVNLLPNVLAKQKAVRAGAGNVVMIRDGKVTESANTNIFGVMNGVLYTHPDDPGILSGVTRLAVFQLAQKLGIDVRHQAILESDLPRLDELFFTGTTTDLLPVVELDGKPVGNGTPGAICRRLQHAFKEKMDWECRGNQQRD